MDIMTAVTATLTTLVLLSAASVLYLDWQKFCAAARDREAADLASLLVGANVWIARHTACAAGAVIIVVFIKLDDTLVGYHPLAVAVAVYAFASFMIAIAESLFAQRIETELKVCSMAKKHFRQSV